MAAYGRRLILILIFLACSAVYLYPGFSPVVEGNTARVMSDGTDSAPVPYYYALILELWKNKPSDLFFGAVPAPYLNAPEGMALWIPWIERFGALVLTPFVPFEHISTVLAAIMMSFNALCMYALGRKLGWSRSLAFAVALAWAFSPFTRGRAQVHGLLAATYHVPLAMYGVLLAFQGRSLLSLAGAAACFLLVGMAPHYFVVTLAFVSPFLILLGWLSLAKRVAGKRLVLRLLAAVLPMVGLLGWCYFKPLPAEYTATGPLLAPPSGETMDGGPHPFLSRYAAHPIDYFTGDLVLGTKDWNPLRSALSEKVLAHLGESNPHERANGIRWIVWLLVIAALVVRPPAARPLQIGLLVFGLFAFWLSLSPDVLWPSSGPSYWLYSLVSQIRVPSRAGIFVHFCALLLAGLFFHQWIESRAKNSRWRRLVALPGILPLLMFADLPPFIQPMPLAPVRPQLSTLVDKECGSGLYFPYVAGNIGVLEDYHFLQEMRGSRCDILNVQWPNARSEKLAAAMGISQNMIESFNRQSPFSTRAIVQLASCVPLSWIVFDPRTDDFARASLCRSLGWSMTEARVCQTPGRPRPLRKKPEECI